MKLALLKGNRFNPWHLQAFAQLGEDVEVTAFSVGVFRYPVNTRTNEPASSLTENLTGAWYAFPSRISLYSAPLLLNGENRPSLNSVMDICGMMPRGDRMDDPGAWMR